MKVKINKHVSHKNLNFQPGDVIELNDIEADHFLEYGLATEYVEKEEKIVKQTKELKTKRKTKGNGRTKANR